MSKTPLSVSKLTAAIKTGSRVTRGADWKGDDQDGPPPGDGTVIEERTDGCISILSDTGYRKKNRMGFSGQYGLKAVDSLAVQRQNPFSESVKQNGNTVRVKCSYCKRAFVEDCLSSHELKCLDRPIRCPTCNVVVPLRMWVDHECQTVRMKATEKLVDDLAELIQKDEFSDITVKVKEKEYKLHRSILAARNTYFNALFKKERKKKNTTTGIISIEDCDSDTFYSFIYFVYTGQIKKLSEDNVCALYEAASKYQEQQLKEECLCYMKNKVSVNSCCDFLVLALKHDEKELFKSASEYFCKKTNAIIKTVKWQTFIKKYSIQANELFIKSFECNAK